MFKKSNIFHLIPSFYPDIGGAEKQLERLSIEQRKAGYNVNIITRKSKKNNNVDSKKFKNITVIRYSRNMFIYNIKTFFYLIKKRFLFNVIHVHTLTSVAFTAMIFSFFFKKKVLLKLTRVGDGSQIDLIKKSNFKAPVFRTLIHLCSPKFICLTEESKKYLNKNFKNASDIIIPNGIPINNEKKIIHNDNYIRILFVSRLISRKQVFKTINEIINHNFEYIRIIVCGEGPESKKILNLKKEYGKLIDFRGKQDKNGIEKAMKESDYFIQNSINEGLSNSFLEALSYNVIPVVSKLDFYQDLKNQYGIPIFFTDFIKMSTDQKISFKRNNKSIPKKIASEKFDIKNTVKLLSNLYE